MRSASAPALSILVWLSLGCGDRTAIHTSAGADAADSSGDRGSAGGSSGSAPNGATSGASGGQVASAPDASPLDAVADAIVTRDVAPALDGGEVGDADDPSSCLSLADAGIAPEAYASVARGSFSGPGFAGTICHGQVYLSYSGLAPNALGLFLNREVITWQAPADVRDGSVFAFVPVTGPTPGTYTETSVPLGGAEILVTYFLPPPDIDCSGGQSGRCPTGCAPAPCPAFGCQGPMVCGPISPIGSQLAQSWTMTLTSVEPYETTQGPANYYYTPHGSLTATFTGGGTLSLTF